MLARYKQGSIFVTIFLILLSSGIPGAFAKPAAKVTASAAPSQWLAGVLSSGSESLLKQAKDAADRTAQVLSDRAEVVGQLQELQRRVALLKTGMEVEALSSPIIAEILGKYSAIEEDLSSQLNKLTSEIKDVEKRRAKQSASLSATDAQIKILKGLSQPGASAVLVQSAYDGYAGACAAFFAGSGRLVDALTEKARLLKQQKDLLDGVLPGLKKLQQASMCELLRSGGAKPLGRQLSDLACAIGALPRQAWSWFLVLLDSRLAVNFFLKSWAPLTGLLLFMVFLGWGARFLKRRLQLLMDYVRPRSRETGIRFLVRVACGLISVTYQIAFLLWATAACAVLGLFGLVPALTVLYLLTGLVVLLTAVRVIKDVLCGTEAETSCFPDIDHGCAPALCRRLQAFAAFVVLGGVFVPILGLGKFPITLKLLVGQLYGIGVLLGTCILLRPGHLKKIIAPPVSPKWAKWLGYTWASLLFLLILVCLMELLGFVSFSIYAIRAAVLTEALIACALLLALVGKGVLKEIFEREHRLHRVFDAVDIQFRQLYFPARLALSVLLFTGLAAGLLLTWGLGSASLMRFVDHLEAGVSLGSFHLSPVTVLVAALVLFAGFRGSGVFGIILRRRVLPRTGWDLGVQYSIASIIQYTIIIACVLLAMNILGFPLGSLALLAGAMGIGAGLGLQNVIANFVSGLVLLFERPVKVGDTLIVDGQWGEVRAIKMRSTVFQTFDRSVLIIPNSDLLSGKIVNWNHYGYGPNRLKLKVGVSYSSDVKLVTRLLQEICEANPRVLKDPPPQTFFEAYGDSSLDFSIRVYLRTASERVPATHEINTAIFEAFQENGIEIPFPQRDLHIIDERKRSPNGVEELQAPGQSLVGRK